MLIVSLLMQLVPGLIAVRILWSKRATSAIVPENYKFIACDYLIYSFLIQLAVYGFMFITYSERSVSFAIGVGAVSHILSASFVFKYSVVALAAAMVLPIVVPWLTTFKLEFDNEQSKIRSSRTSGARRASKYRKNARLRGARRHLNE